MNKASVWILTAGIALYAVASAWAQTGFGGTMTSGPMGPMGPMGMPASPELEELQKEQAELMKEADPELADYQEKMRSVQDEIGKVTKSLAAEEIDKDEARAQLLPLIKEEQELRDDPGFRAEQLLSQAAFSTPEFQKKMAKIQERMNKAMQKLMAKRLRAPNTRPAPNARPQSGPAR